MDRRQLLGYIKKWKKPIIVLFWLLVWHCTAKLVNNNILLVTPWEALCVLADNVFEVKFWKILLFSLLRILTGLLSGVILALLLAYSSYRFGIVESILKPVMSLLKTIPVVSFVVILLVWMGSDYLSVSICFLIVFPSIYINTLEGFKAIPQTLLEMKRIYNISGRDSFLYLYRPVVEPFFVGAMKVALGLCWKSGVAAEVIGTPSDSIGEMLYLSKVSLDTGGIFAWTAVIILLSLAFEKGMLLLIHRFFEWQPTCRGSRRGEGNQAATECLLECRNIWKSYDGQMILQDYNECFMANQEYKISWESGKGKTTLLRLLARLEEADQGALLGTNRISLMFQENCLIEKYSAVKNIELVTGDETKARELLEELLDKGSLYKPCSKLSGGMKRRVALVRAMCYPSDVVLLDEPFTGMDAVTIKRSKEFIKKYQGSRAIIMATHIM